MNKVLIFIPEEKALNNLLRYDVLEKFQKKNYLILTTKEVKKIHPNLKNTITYNSSWNVKNILKFTDYLYLKNFFQKENNSLRMYLRTRILGQYKINSLVNFYRAVKSFINFILNINWAVFATCYDMQPEILLINLRKNNIILSNDTNKYINIFKKNKIGSAISITTLKHPTLFDFSSACATLKISNYVFPDCWDNVSNSPAIPSEITKLCIWSKQQQIHVKNFHSHLMSKSEIYGTYRTRHNKIHKTDYLKYKNLSNTKVLKILYIEGYFYEDLEFVIQRIINSLTLSHLSNLKEILITIRYYPRRRQTENIARKTVIENFFEIKDSIKVKIKPSGNYLLTDDLNETHLVFSELSTAALEAATRLIPVIFICSNRSPRYLDTRRGYSFPFAKDLELCFDIIDLSSDRSIMLLSNAINRNLHIKSVDKSILDFFAPSLDLVKLSNLHKNIELTL